MNLEGYIRAAREEGASDVHLEPGLAAAFRVRGSLHLVGEPLQASALLEWGRNLVGPANWNAFLERRSFDLSKSIAGARCRINILQSARGVGLAIRILASFQATIESLNLHPDLKKLVVPEHGLVLVSGATGSGKSSTLAALIQEINSHEARHILTIESPIEYTFRPRKGFIRQREVGRDTPSFEQALLDALREDPDVLMVGEMRDPETMRLTLNAAETGHLVLATVHSSTCTEALQRVISAFPSEIQASMAAQIADCLVGVVAQRLRFRPDLKIRVPECEILIPTHAIKNFIRNRDFFKIASVLETGAEHGMWTFQRYRGWLDQRKDWKKPADLEAVTGDEIESSAPPLPIPARPVSSTQGKPVSTGLVRPDVGPIEIEPVEGGMNEVLKKLR